MSPDCEGWEKKQAEETGWRGLSRSEWLRDLAAAERELSEAKTVQKVRAVQVRIRQIKHYVEVSG